MRRAPTNQMIFFGTPGSVPWNFRVNRSTPARAREKGGGWGGSNVESWARGTAGRGGVDGRSGRRPRAARAVRWVCRASGGRRAIWGCLYSRGVRGNAGRNDEGTAHTKCDYWDI